MMRQLQRSSVCAALLVNACLTSSPTLASPVPTADVSEMTALADLIIVGKETAATDGEKSQFGGLAVAIKPLRVLKGTLAPRTMALVDARISSDAPKGFNTGDFGMFFLKTVRPGVYRLTDPNIVSVNAYPGDYQATAQGSTPLQRVSIELAGVFTLAASIAGDPATGLSGPTWPTDPAFPGQNVYAATYVAFRYIDPSVALPALDDAVRKSKFPGNAWASATALSLGETSQLGTLLPLMMNPEHAGKLLESFLLQSLISARFSERDLPRLGRLLTSNNQYMRDAAMNALMNLESPASVPILETVIDGPDDDLSKKAIGLICFETNACTAKAKFDYYAKPEHHKKLRELVAAWQKARNE